METTLEQSIVLITSHLPENQSFGTGFVIHYIQQTAFVLTCRHVVSDVGAQHVEVEGYPAAVVAAGEENSAEDIALLRIEGLPEAQPLQLCRDGQPGMEFTTIGYCRYGSHYKLEQLQGTLTKEVWLRSRGQTDRTKAWEVEMQEDSPLQQGYSGAPLIEMSQGMVVGIATHREAQGRKGMALALDVLPKIWPDVAFSPLAEEHAQKKEIPQSFAPNPFGAKGRITNPDDFFDREELLRQIFEELNKGVNISLVGDSAVGKSSLLWKICQQGTASKIPHSVENLVRADFLYFNVEIVDNEDEFYDALCDKLGLASCRGYTLTRALQGKRYVLCIDEVEKMAWEGFTIKVRSHLRGLADGPEAPLKLVIASRSPLARLFPDSPELDSPLAGICHQLDVTPFAPDVARTFLTERLQGTGITFTPAQMDTLIHETSGHPARLQEAAARLYRELMKIKAKKSNL